MTVKSTVMFKQQARSIAAELDVQVRSIAIRQMRRKWASCSTAGRLTFDQQVPSLAPELQRYILYHELLHLKVPNHGRLWKSLMRAHLGEYEELERRLSTLAARPG